MRSRRMEGMTSSERWAATVTTAAFIVTGLALVGIIVILITIGRETDALRSRLDDVDVEARAHLSDLARILALEMAAQRAYRLGGEPASLTMYEELIVEERDLLHDLDSLVVAIGPEASAAVDEIRLLSGEWHRRVEEPDVSGSAGAFIDSTLSIQTGPYARAVGALERLGQSVHADERTHRARLSGLEEREDRLVVLLVAPAGLGIAVLVVVGRRLHRLTLEERRLRSLAERRGRDLERVAEEKGRFVRGITHDLKNPLGVIDGSAELLEMGIHGALTAEQGEVLARIRRVAGEAVSTIEGLMEVAMSEDGTLPVRLDQVDLVQLVRGLAEDYRGPVEAAGMALGFETRTTFLRIPTDPDRVREVLGNLVTNAIRHGSKGSRLVLRIRTIERSPMEGDWVAVDIEDDGPGIPLERQDEIFREGVKGEASDGSGVGLAISRRILRSLGGELTLESTPGHGATFTILLPLPTEAPPSLG